MSNNQRYLYRSPFNFLNPYQKKDKNIFYGRSQEINQVFNLFKKTNLVILYGPSGSGKSSMAQCGLANKFHDWKSLTIRRNDDFVESFFSYLTEIISDKAPIRAHFEKTYTLSLAINELEGQRQALHIKSRQEQDSKETASMRKRLGALKKEIIKLENTRNNELEELEEVISLVYTNISYTPFFIFDQFEELFIEGDGAEIMRFGLLLSLVTSKLSFSNTVICIQTDFFAELLNLEKYNPNLLDYKCLIDDPTDENISEIIHGTFNYFNINQFEVPSGVLNVKNLTPLAKEEKDGRVRIIIDKLKKDDKVHLPFLQIYLDNLYVQDFVRTYPTEAHILLQPQSLDFTKRPLEFSPAEINSYGDIVKILTAYIRDINDELDRRMNKRISQKREDMALKFLQKFVSGRNTMKTVEIVAKPKKGTLEEDQATYLDIVDAKLKKDIKTNIWNQDAEDPTTDELLGDIIDELVRARILKRRDNYLELSHNLLARIIKTIPIDRDILEYYRSHFNSAFSTYQREKESGLRRPSLLSGTQVEKIQKDIKHILPDDKTENDKTAFWKKSVFWARFKKRAWTGLLIASLLSSVIALGFYMESAQKSKKLIVERLKIKISNEVGAAINESKTDRTLAYKHIIHEVADSINKYKEINAEDIELYNPTRNNLIHDFSKKPFYLKKLALSPNVIDRKILATKSRLKGKDKDTLVLFAKTRSNLFTTEFSLKTEDTAKVSWKPIPSSSNITAYKPYNTKDGDIRILYSNAEGTFDIGASANDTIKISHPQSTFKNIVSIDKISDENFLGLDANNTTLHHINLSGGKMTSRPISETITYELPRDDDANRTDKFSSEDSPIRFLKKGKGNMIYYIANLNRQIPCLIQLDANSYKVNNILNLNLVKPDIKISDIKAVNLSETQQGNFILIADQRLVHAINLDNLDEPDTNHMVKVNPHHEESINSIDNFGHWTMIGSDDKTASIYFDENFDKSGDEVLSKVLIGHKGPVHNVSFREVQETLYAITSGEDGTISVWDLSPIEKESIKLQEAEGPLKIRYNDTDKRLYVGFTFNNTVGSQRRGYLKTLNPALAGAGVENLKAKDYRNSSNLTAFDFTQGNSVLVGTDWNQFLRYASKTPQLQPYFKLNSRIKEVRIRENRLVAATHNYLFFFNDTSLTDTPKRLRIEDVRFNSVDLHPTKDLVLGTSDNGKIYLWDPSQGQDCYEVYDQHTEEVKDASFSSNGDYFVSGSWDNTAVVWQLVKKKNAIDLCANDTRKKHSTYYRSIKTIKAHTSDIEDIEINEKDIIAIGSSDKTVSLHKISRNNTGKTVIKQLESLIKHNFDIESISFMTNSDYIFTADKNGYIKKWNYRTFEQEIDKRISN